MKTKQIIQMAADKQICQPWHDEMKKDSSIENLCRMYFDGDDWAMENDFPDVHTLDSLKDKQTLTECLRITKHSLKQLFIKRVKVHFLEIQM